MTWSGTIPLYSYTYRDFIAHLSFCPSTKSSQFSQQQSYYKSRSHAFKTDVYPLHSLFKIAPSFLLPQPRRETWLSLCCTNINLAPALETARPISSITHENIQEGTTDSSKDVPGEIEQRPLPPTDRGRAAWLVLPHPSAGLRYASEDSGVVRNCKVLIAARRLL